ncbi:MAG: 4-hydroxythreonine-4-phosphate dehydrogenase PdxA [Acidobacteria bacterium]|nr:4-hydroxythreonine-4-phosphate dehydrogenase PdxA [Acidobacteriota bacterium]
MRRIIVTMGDPFGIGPEVTLKALTRLGALPPDTALAVFGDVASLLLSAPEDSLKSRLPILPGCTHANRLPDFSCVVDFSNVPDAGTFGREDASGGRACLDYLEAAVDAWRRGEAQGLVTAPISKRAIALAGSPFQGHTEMLAALTGAGKVLMAFHLPEFWTVLGTTHVSLRKAIEALTTDHLTEVIGMAHREIARFIPAPRIAVAGLNPHASEGGLMGEEEARVIEPAVRACRESGIPVSGPWPADSVFRAAMEGEFDVVVAHYHDQGLIPVKLLGFGRAVNVTLGLPFPRFSPAHGTAFDIAGDGVADPSGMLAALRLALDTRP